MLPSSEMCTNHVIYFRECCRKYWFSSTWTYGRTLRAGSVDYFWSKRPHISRGAYLPRLSNTFCICCTLQQKSFFIIIFFYITANQYVYGKLFPERQNISHKINFSRHSKRRDLFYDIIYCDIIYWRCTTNKLKETWLNKVKRWTRYERMWDNLIYLFRWPQTNTVQWRCKF